LQSGALDVLDLLCKFFFFFFNSKLFFLVLILLTCFFYLLLSLDQPIADFFLGGREHSSLYFIYIYMYFFETGSSYVAQAGLEFAR
jgi:hypothetical protein